MSDLFHRIRWANVARAVALLLAALLALAWPRLKSHDDALPPALAEPVTVADEGSAVEDDAPLGEAVDGEDGARGEAEAAPGEDDAPVDHVDSDARREAARRKTAKRRAARRAAAERAKKRRRTVARRRRTAATTTSGVAPGAGAVPSAGAVPAWRPAPPVAPGAEFRP